MQHGRQQKECLRDTTPSLDASLDAAGVEPQELMAVTLACIGHGVIATDVEGRITAINSVAEAMTGWTQTNATGQPWDKVLRLVHEPTREVVPDPMPDVIVGGGPRPFPPRTVLLARNGATRGVEGSIAPIRTTAARIMGCLIVFHDVTGRRHAEKALRESNERFRAIIQATPECVKVVAADGTLLAMNAAGCAMVEAESDQEVVGKSVYGLIAPEFRQQFAEFNARICQGQKGRLEYEMVGLQGTRRWMETRAVPMRDPATGEYTSLGVSRDVTDRKSSEEQLRNNEEQLRTLADSIPQLAWIAGPDGHVFWYNRKWYEYTGATPAELNGWGWQSFHDPKVLPEVMERWKASLATGTPFEMEFPLRGADGVFRWFLTRCNPVRDLEGHVVRWFGTNTNVDEVRKVREALQEETRILEMLNSTGRAIAVNLDLHTVVQTVTDAATKLCGADFGAFFYNTTNAQGEAYTLYTLSGAPREAFDKFGHPRATPLFGPTFRGEGVIRSDDVLQDPRYGQMPPHHGMPKGHLPVRSYLAVPVISRSGEVIGGLFFGHRDTGVFTERTERLVVGVAAQAAVAIDNARLYQATQREVEERKRAEEALSRTQEKLSRHAEELERQVELRTASLREAIAQLEEFSYTVSHDLRAPLRAISGYNRILTSDYGATLPGEGQLFLEKIARSTERMQRLVEDVLTMSRVARAQIELSPILLQPFLEHLIEHQPEMQPGAADITIDAPHRVLGDEAPLGQAVFNLLSNAVKFVPLGTKPVIKVRSEQVGDRVRLWIEDNGIGIKPEHQGRLFGMFERLPTSSRYEGTGIGLAIVRKAVERMNGTVGVESDGNTGSRFWVELKGVP